MNSQRLIIVAIFLVLGFMAYSRFNTPTSGDRDSVRETNRQSGSDLTPQELPFHTAKEGPTKPPSPRVQAETFSKEADRQSQAPKRDEGRLPRGPDDLRESQFISKYKEVGINSLLDQKPVLHFPGVITGTLFMLNNADIIGGDGHGEVRFRSSIAPFGSDGVNPHSCVSILGPDKVPIVGSIGDGSLTIRHGPIAHSFLLSISEKHFFLTYADTVRWEEHRNNVPPDDSSDGNGALLYFLRGSDNKITYQGHRLRWDDQDVIGTPILREFCLKTFGDLR